MTTPILLVAALGLVGIYLLLPRPRTFLPSFRLARWVGGALAILALATAGWLYIRTEIVTPETILFYAFSAVAISGGGLLVTQRNPVHAALAFALVVLSTCGLFLLLAAPFLMAATIIIYAGAIIVTFLFVIMLAQQAGFSDADSRSREPFLSCLAGFVLLSALLFALFRTYDTREFDRLLAQTGQAAEQTSVQDARAILANPADFFDRFEEQAKKARVSPSLSTVFIDALLKARESLNKRDANRQDVKQQLALLYERGSEVRASYGSLQPRQDLPLSGYSYASKKLLPAENVAYLGRTLFTDYLLAVELGGTLLLVAAIGTIVIAGRRTGELR
jgi:NADH:ubiquinone oxidoreductase subunit 6 (subunit J)